jgi:hypothetical protein
MIIEKTASKLTTINIDAQHRVDEHQEIYFATSNMLRTVFLEVRCNIPFYNHII